MFWKVFEFVVRIIYFRRFRAAKRIGDAGKLLGDGKPREALDLLEQVGRNLHQTLLPIFAFTRGKIMDALGRSREAEEAFRLVVLTDPANSRADLELAILAGRRRDFQQCEEWLDRFREKGDEDLADQAEGIRELLHKCTSGEREAEFRARAEEMAAVPIGQAGETAGLPPDLALLDGWIESDPAAARERLDEMALLIGQGLVERGALWRVSLSLDESVVTRDDGATLDPFLTVARRLEEPSSNLQDMLAEAWTASDS